MNRSLPDLPAKVPTTADGTVVFSALAAAYTAFGLTFRGPRARFWQRMTLTGLALGSLAIAADRDLRRLKLRVRDVALGLVAAGGLYVVFQVGDRLARRIMPRGAEEIGEVYALRSLRPRPELAARLALVIGPAEELFWRGFLQRRLGRGDRWRGAALASAAYGGAHLAAANPTLVGAAVMAGGFWSVLAAAGVSIPALIVSHVAWDVWIFLVAPTGPKRSPGSMNLAGTGKASS
jgi:membrane protease YdiL (CAAX protease family)